MGKREVFPIYISKRGSSRMESLHRLMRSCLPGTKMGPMGAHVAYMMWLYRCNILGAAEMMPFQGHHSCYFLHPML